MSKLGFESLIPSSEMHVRRIAWLGVRTEHADAMVAFLQTTLGLRLEHLDEGQWVFSLPDGSKAEVFSSESPHNEHFERAPVAGFYVEDVAAAAEELRQAGVEIVHGPVFADDADAAWVHFRAPDGNLYELTQGSDLDPPAPPG
jgi:catechol 2,3-dioxygenase-like lactoylglutathione lyase family enzyme